MDFSIKWAGVSAAYVGMAYGAWRIWSVSAGSGFSLFGAGVGMLFGGGMALPFVASNFAAAALAAWLLRGQPFVIQFTGFMLLSCLLGSWMLHLLNDGLHVIGDLHLDREGKLMLAAAAAATYAIALLLMRLQPAPAHA